MKLIEKTLHTRLALEFHRQLELVLDSNLPSEIYREFGTESAADNFQKGNIWFSGPNQNRFFASPDRKDEFEYRNTSAICILEYSLSFTIDRSITKGAVIRIRKVKDFIRAIGDDLEKTQNQDCHYVSWLCMQDFLQEYILHIPAIRNIKKYPSLDTKKILLPINNIGAYLVQYDDKIITDAQVLDVNGKYDSPKVVKNAYLKNSKFKDEKELRIHINTGDFCDPEYNGNSLHHLVQYLKLHCPSISKYCEKIS